MKEPRYILIHCSIHAQGQARHLIAHPEQMSRCYAEKVEGSWRCLCCGKTVSVVW